MKICLSYMSCGVSLHTTNVSIASGVLIVKFLNRLVAYTERSAHFPAQLKVTPNSITQEGRNTFFTAANPVHLGFCMLSGIHRPATQAV